MSTPRLPWLIAAAVIAIGCAGTPPLHEAAESGDSAALERILATGGSPNLTDDQGRSALHFAAREGQLRSVVQLIQSGSRIDARDQDGETPLFLATEEGHTEVVETLLENGADPNLANRDRRTPLIVAADKGYERIVRSLLRADADPSVRDRDRVTALMRATDRRNLEIVDLLLATPGADPDTPDRDGRTPLYRAVDQRDSEIAESLLEWGADPNVRNRNGEAPLWKAVQNRDHDLVQALLEHRADPDTLGPNRNPLLTEAARQRDSESIEMLLEAKADPNVRSIDGFSPLLIAVQQHDTESAELLLEAGAKPDAWSSGGQTPLYVAVIGRDHAMAGVLLEGGAAPDAPNQNGARPLVVAINSQDRGMADLLLAAGARPTTAAEAFADPAAYIRQYGYKGIIGAAMANASDEVRKANETAATATATASSTAATASGSGTHTPQRVDLEAASGPDPIWGAEEPVAPTVGPIQALADGYYSRRVAVVVGIDQYPGWPSLEGARRDAGQVSARLRRMGFDEVIELYDGEATRRRILTALGNELAEKTDENSMAVIYFAGHGQTESLPGGRKRGYIVPVDSDPSQVFATAISMDTLRSISQRLPAKQVYYAMDSCYSGLGFTRGIAIPRKKNEDYIEKITSQPTVQMITAGAEGEQALERGGQGIFTRYFLRALEGEADFDGDGWVTASELGTFVRPQVTSASRSRQTPRFGTLEGTGEVAFRLAAP
jgi:cytohesin